MTVIQPTSLIPVKVTGNWGTAANIYTDVVASLEASFPGVFSFPATDSFTLTLTQVQSLYTEKSTIVVNTNGTVTVSTAFSATPAVDSVVYIIDMY